MAMNQRLPKTKVRMETSAAYRILVQGGLDSRWSDRLGGLSITSSAVQEEMVVTQLTGELMDQAALLGVLNTLYELHLPLLSVSYVASETT